MKLLGTIDLAVPGVGAAASAILAAFGLHSIAAGALSGTVIATASWSGLHLIGRRLTSAGGGRRTFFAVLMAVKLVAVASLVLVTVTVLGFDAMGVGIGMSALPAGIILGVALRGTGDDGEKEPTAEVKDDA